MAANISVKLQSVHLGSWPQGGEILVDQLQPPGPPET
jgi:hypothetical protein